MAFKKNTPEFDLHRKLKWLIFFRVLFALVILASATFVGIREQQTFFTPPLVFLNAIAGLAILLSLIYAAILRWTRRLILLGYVQIIIDTFLITGIIFLTGSFSSIFSFLYLLVIIYASMVLFRNGGMVTAVLCSIQYGVMVDLEYYGIIHPFDVAPDAMMANYDWNYVIFKLLMTIIACFAVAFLAGYLSEQEKRAKRDLWAMEAQVKRVEKLAAIGEMAAGLAHEIKNPLASMSGAIQVLRDEVSHKGDQGRLMGIVLRESDRISSLVNEFLMFARPQPGNKKVVVLDRELREIIKQFETSNPNQKPEIRKSLNPDIPVEIDPEHFRQVVWNLLLNAMEAAARPGQIDVELYTQDHQYACMVISDNGCGMSEEIQQSIFDPFFTRKAKGTGLGLSIVQRILTSYDGLIDVQSVPDQGSTFTVKLPLAGASPPTNEPSK
ncbi:MAG TPA: ATP-binding protein [Desulfosalsimonadaceae bacterium]|nr:ATP-binding protein [Desulfosalsimonadaceae bacterium]